MRLPRFFVSPDVFSAERATVSGDSAHQIRHVLRLGMGERIVLLDNTGWEHEVELETVERDAVSGRVVAKRLAQGEPRVRVTLYQALLKADKFEWVLQKGTEIGVAAFVPLVTERCVRDTVSAAKAERWQRIVREAAEQSERGLIPALSEPLPFADAVQRAGQHGWALIPYEAEQTHSLRAVLQRNHDARDIGLFIGPEGGFSTDEITIAQQQRVTSVTLGPRILRAETAGLVATTAVLYEWGETDAPLSMRERGWGEGESPRAFDARW